MKGIAMYGHDFFVIKEDDDLISESIARLFNTNQNERVKYPYMGIDLKRMLFELADEDSEGIIRENILEQIETYEPRVKISNIAIEYVGENTYNIKLSFYRIQEPDDVRFLEFELHLNE